MYQARQTRYQGRQHYKVQVDSKYEYSIPVYNKFANLAGQSYQGNY